MAFIGPAGPAGSLGPRSCPRTHGPSVTTSLRQLPVLLHDEPALTRVLGRSSAVLAVPEPARAITIAGLARLSSRRPMVVAVPTSTDAERLVHDLAAFLGEDDVELFPAWETLPFERVSPSVEAMGRRLRTMWRLTHGAVGDPSRSDRLGAPSVVVAPVRALVQRLGPHVDDVEPVVVGHEDRSTRPSSWPTWSAAGYRREELVEHRGEVAVRGSIVDVFPSTADVPVRIDLWGDEVDRLTEFSVTDQRSTADIAEVEIFPCRELLPTDEVRARAEALIATEPWGREQWERSGRRAGVRRHGVVAAVAGRRTSRCCSTCSSRPAQVLLVEPRRMRDRAADILAEEADLAATLAVTWGAATSGGATGFPQLHLDFDRLLAHTAVPAWTVTTAPEGPDVATVAAAGWPPVVGDGRRARQPARASCCATATGWSSPRTAKARPGSPAGRRGCSATRASSLEATSSSPRSSAASCCRR